MLALLSFVALAQAAAIFTNSSSVISTSLSTPLSTPSNTQQLGASSSSPSISSNTSAPQSLITPAPSSTFLPFWSIEPCEPNGGQDCSRSGNPWYTNYGSAEYKNPYYPAGFVAWSREGANATVDAAFQASCGSIWQSSLDEWLSTAPISISTTLSAYLAGISVSGTTETIYTTWEVWGQTTRTSLATAFQTTFTSYFQELTLTTSSWEWTVTGETSYWTLPPHVSAYYVSDFSYTPSGACCSSCILSGGEVQVMHWPTPAPSPATSMLVDTTNNFTFVSPSVYVVFKSLTATNMCGSMGSFVTAMTLAFSQGELSTQQISTYGPLSSGQFYPWYANYYDNGGFTEATWSWASDPSCTVVTTSYYKVDGGLYAQDFSDYAAASSFVASMTQSSYVSDTFINDVYFPVTWSYFVSFNPALIGLYSASYNPCSPLLAIPTKLYSVNPGWSSCVPGISAFFDPPYPLTAGPSLTALAITAVADLATSTTTSAAAGSTPTDGAAPQTSTSIAAPVSTVDPGTSTSTSAVDPASTVDPTTSLDPPVVVPNQPSSQSTLTSIPSVPVASSTLVLVPVTPTTTSTPAVITFAGSTVTADPSSNFQIGTQTLAPGSQVTVSNTVLSLASNGASLVVVDPSTTNIQILAPSATQAPSAFVVQGQTLSAGGNAVTISGTTLSLQAGGSSVVVNGQTSPVAVFLPSSSTVTTVTEAGILLGSQTLIAGGPAVTVSGTILSLQSAGASVVFLDPSGKATLTQAASVLIAQGGKSTSVVVTQTSLAVVGSSRSQPTSVTSTGIGGAIISVGGFATTSTTSKSSSTSTKVGSTSTKAPFNGTIFVAGSSSGRNDGNLGLMIMGFVTGLFVLTIRML